MWVYSEEQATNKVPGYSANMAAYKLEREPELDQKKMHKGWNLIGIDEGEQVFFLLQK